MPIAPKVLCEAEPFSRQRCLKSRYDEKLKGGETMNSKKVTLAALFAITVLGLIPLGAEAQEGILLKVRAGDTNYCHLKFPAIRQDTLSWDRPVLQGRTGAIVDFYGPCDHDPTGKAEVAEQKRAQRSKE